MLDYATLLSPFRFSSKAEDFLAPVKLEEAQRSAFARDCDRLIFSPHFRRLGGKTQVHPENPALGDVHNRLTHSVEVARVGRSLGLIVGNYLRDYFSIPIHPLHFAEAIEAACLAHDIGNPPIGHSGEMMIRAWFSQNEDKLSKIDKENRLDFLHFNGNAQGFRLLTRGYDNTSRKGGGLRLSFASLGAFLKYPNTSKEGVEEFSVPSDMEKSLIVLIQKLQLTVGKKVSRSPLVYLMEAADDICYAILDIEDAASMGILKEEQVKDAINCLKEMSAQEAPEEGDNLQKISHLRSHAINHAIHEVARVFIVNHEAILSGDSVNLIHEKVKSTPLQAVQTAKELARKHIYSKTHDERLKKQYEPHFNTLFTYLFEAKDFVDLSGRIQKLGYNESGYFETPKEDSSPYELAATITDFVCHLTDKELARYGEVAKERL